LKRENILLYLVEKLKKSQTDLARFSEAGLKISKFEKENEVDAKRIADLEYTLSTQV
jgi:hypothetical protein